MGRDQEKLRTAPGRTAQEEAEDERRWPEGHFGSDKETLGSGQGEEGGGVASPGESWPEENCGEEGCRCEEKCEPLNNNPLRSAHKDFIGTYGSYGAFLELFAPALLPYFFTVSWIPPIAFPRSSTVITG